MNRNRGRVIEIVDNSSSQSEKVPPESILFAIEVFYTSTLTSSETLEALKSFEIRRDNMILGGYPKTATFVLLHFFPLALKRMNKLPSGRIIQIHLPPHLLPPSMLQSKAKILALLRNPKDTDVSYYCFYNNILVMLSFISWDEYFAAFMKGKYNLSCILWHSSLHEGPTQDTMRDNLTPTYLSRHSEDRQKGPCYGRIRESCGSVLPSGSYFDHLVERNKYIDHERIMVISCKELKEVQHLTQLFLDECTVHIRSFPPHVSNDSAPLLPRYYFLLGVTALSFQYFLLYTGVVGNWRDLFSKAQNEEMDQKI
ncbi:sulfotransferase 6B1-like [Pezoporus occidentalis]|uniref:sulfotransferase 6B1-like n=1 Tax=Pezoporus occidentalis TaxID=407982 RepID=UPI002F910507